LPIKLFNADSVFGSAFFIPKRYAKLFSGNFIVFFIYGIPVFFLKDTHRRKFASFFHNFEKYLRKRRF